MRKKSTQRVLVVGSGSLFDEGLSSLLMSKAQLEVSNIIYTNDETFVRDFLRKRPQVVVIFEGGPLNVGRVFELVKDVPNLPALRVITVLSHESKFDVYEKQHFTARKSDDLVTLLQRDNNSL